MNIKKFIELEESELELVNHLKIFGLEGLAEEATEEQLARFTESMTNVVNIMDTEGNEDVILYLYNIALISMAKLVLKYDEKEFIPKPLDE